MEQESIDFGFDTGTEIRTETLTAEETAAGTITTNDVPPGGPTNDNAQFADGLDFDFEIKPLGPSEIYTPFSDPIITTETTPSVSRGDSENNYDELLKAYKEVKDQNRALRKDKKQLSARVEELESKVRTQEITLRENAEAIDSLSFNNQRLTKRVAVMQSQNAQDSASGGLGGGGGGGGGGGWFSGLMWSSNNTAAAEIKKLREELAVTKQDLAIKIQENVFMHVQVEDQKEEFDKKMEKLEREMDSMKTDLETQISVITGSLNKQTALVTKTSQERDDCLKLIEEQKSELSQ